MFFFFFFFSGGIRGLQNGDFVGKFGDFLKSTKPPPFGMQRKAVKFGGSPAFYLQDLDWPTGVRVPGLDGL